MKHCTIIYDGPPLTGLFNRPLSAQEKLGFDCACIDTMMDEVESLARRLGLEEAVMSWTGTARNPARLGVVCADPLAGQLRMRLPDFCTVELDG